MKNKKTLKFEFGQKVVYDNREVIILGVGYNEQREEFEYSIRNMRAMSGVITVLESELKKGGQK